MKMTVSELIKKLHEFPADAEIAIAFSVSQ